MRCSCGRTNFALANDQNAMVRMILLLMLCHKVRCRYCNRSRVVFLPYMWISLLFVYKVY